MLQFTTTVQTTTRAFWFEGLKPRADTHDSLGGGFCKKKLQESLDRGMFYCWADNIGTVRNKLGEPCTAGNYEPAWTSAAFTYPVKSRWAEDLWKAYKRDHVTYERYLLQSRDGYLAKKRNLDACKEKEEQVERQRELEERTKRIRSNPDIFKPFPRVVEAETWLETFKADRLRYPLLVVLGQSLTGKTEWAQTLFRNPLVVKIGCLEHFPETMRAFDRKKHDGLILDDLRDLQFLVAHQDKIQGKYNSEVEFASTPGGGLAYWRDLFAVPVIATCNYSTENLKLLEHDDFLSNAANRTLVRFPPPA